MTPFLNKISLNFFAEQYSLKFQRAYQLIQKKTLDEQKARLKAQNILIKAQQDALEAEINSLSATLQSYSTPS